MRIKVSKYNSEGYYSPTEYEGMMNVLREEYERKQALKKKVFMPKVFICSPFRGIAKRGGVVLRLFQEIT